MQTIAGNNPKVNKSKLTYYLGISRSMFYYKHKRPDIDEEIKHQIESVLTTHKAYGHRRIALELKLNKKRILRVMKKFNIKPYRRRPKKFVKKDDLEELKVYLKMRLKNFAQLLQILFG